MARATPQTAEYTHGQPTRRQDNRARAEGFGPTQGGGWGFGERRAQSVLARRAVVYPHRRVEAPSVEEVCEICRADVLPLVDADGGSLFVVAATAEEIHIHLAGTCAGCPGASLTREQLIVPALALVARHIPVRVTTGYRIPAGATRVR